jgi:hypothetical protein
VDTEYQQDNIFNITKNKISSDNEDH